jgi:hypothetical protein
MFDALIKVALILAIGFIAFVLLYTYNTRSEESYSEIDLKHAAYCSLYAREAVFINLMHGPSFTADTDVILGKAKEHYSQCLSILPALLPLPEKTGTLEQWLADIRDLVILKAGTQPAKEQPVADEETWKEQCRAEYKSWDEETGTVVRKGNPERVRCPCGGEVQCGQ